MRLVLVLCVACSAPDRSTSQHAASAPQPPVAASPAGTAPAVAADDARPPQLAVIQSLGGLDVVESVTHEIHMHGGPPARVGAVLINIDVHDQRAHELVVRKLELLRRHCRETSWHDRTRLAISGYEVYGWTTHDPIEKGTASARIPTGGPRRVQVRVLFAPVEAYQACDLFAFAAELAVDRVPVKLELPLEVTREEPLREP